MPYVKIFILQGPWSVSNGGVTYTFRNGHSLTGYGSLSNGGSIGAKYRIPFRNGQTLTGYGSTANGGSFGIRYTIPLGRKRRSAGDEPKQDISNGKEIETDLSTPKPLHATDEDPDRQDKLTDQTKLTAIPDSLLLKESADKKSDEVDKCEDCLDIQPFNIKDAKVENTTIANNDFVMVVKLIDENVSLLKLDAKIKFEVVEVVKSPVQTITAGQTFTIQAEMSECPCLTSFDEGYYVVIGSMNKKNQLILSNTLMEFEN